MSKQRPIVHGQLCEINLCEMKLEPQMMTISILSTWANNGSPNTHMMPDVIFHFNQINNRVLYGPNKYE